VPSPVDHAERAEQQRESERTDVGAGAEHHAERDRDQPAQDEHRPRPARLAGPGGRADLGEAADDRPDAHDQHQY
jgi:hypothetical protein